MTTCIVCGCTDEDACVRDNGRGPVACSWAHIEGASAICSFCAEDEGEEQLVDAPPEPRLILPGDPEFHL